MTTLDDSLAAEYEVPDDDEARERFVVDDPGKADWALTKLAIVERQMAENAALADHKKQLVDEWHERADRPLLRDQRFFTGLLIAWWRDELAKALADAGGDWSKVRAKSRTLPSGKVGGTFQQPIPEYTDEQAAVKWLAEHLPELVNVTTKPKKDDVKAAIKAGRLAVANGEVVDTESGEPVPGISVPEVADVLDALKIDVKASAQ